MVYFNSTENLLFSTSININYLLRLILYIRCIFYNYDIRLYNVY